MYIGLGLIATVTAYIILKRENARRDRGERDEIIGQDLHGVEKNGKFDTIADAKREKGDAWSGYRYML